MRTRFTSLTLLFLIALPASLSGQGLTTRAAAPADVHSIDAIIAAFYDVISRPAGVGVDWARDSTLYLADLRFKIAAPTDGGARIRVIDHGTYASSFNDTSQGFFEREVHRVTQQYGPIAQVFSTYEWSTTDGGPVEGRGINAIELFHDGERWWIGSAMWVGETDGLPVPTEYLPRGRDSAR